MRDFVTGYLRDFHSKFGFISVQGFSFLLWRRETNATDNCQMAGIDIYHFGSSQFSKIWQKNNSVQQQTRKILDFSEKLPKIDQKNTKIGKKLRNKTSIIPNSVVVNHNSR